MKLEQRYKLAEFYQSQGLYDPAEEHDNCGVGMVVSVEGKSTRQIVEMGIQALKSIWHRGAVGSDGKTGDGAGIHIQIPQDFFKEQVARSGHQWPGPNRLAIGMIFLPRTDLMAQERCRSIVESEILRVGYTIYGWRQVPTDIKIVGDSAKATKPEIEQVMINNSLSRSEPEFERDLFLIRRRIENRVLAEHIKDFYICSFSCRSVIYKGMFLAEQLADFYPDLKDERFVSNFAIFHQRYSTNTFPNWCLAQPFRILAHNGEINTLKGNSNWMKAHEPMMKSELFGERMKDLLPVIQPGGSDSAGLDAVFELLLRAGRNLPMVKTLTIPDTWTQRPAVPEAHRDLYEYCNSVMEPWDGPAAIVAYDSPWMIAGMDRNGLRPLRYSLTADQILVVGSESGMISLDEITICEKGRIGPGQMIAVNLAEGKFYRDAAIKDELAASKPFGKWRKEVTVIHDLRTKVEVQPSEYNEHELLRRQISVGWTQEDLELLLKPMVLTGKEAVGSMGDDTPLAVLSNQYRGLHHFFRQKFAQVTNPPIDSLRERQVMSLKTRLRNLGNILDESPEQCQHVQLETPLLFNSEFETVRAHMGDNVAELDCTFEVHPPGHRLQSAIDHLQRQAEAAVRQGCSHLTLSDRQVNEKRAIIPMILAVGAVHSHLVRTSLRTLTSVNARVAECLDPHYFAVLIGVGATTVNPYLVEETVIRRRQLGMYGDLTAEDALENYRQAVNEGLLKIMSKLGISVISSYRGGYNFETLGLSRSLVEGFFPEMPSRISGMGLPGIEKRVTWVHEKAWLATPARLPVGGFYRLRKSEEKHALTDEAIHLLQTAVDKGSYGIYLKFSQLCQNRPPIALRDLLDFHYAEEVLTPDDVESITEIRKRFVSPGMSLGALSKEAHETLAIAMNRIGAKSCSGEGGEDPQRVFPRSNGDNANSAVKQIASGRFGVTADYLNSCGEIEIKIAQGAKPGEGGQLPGFKVTPEIAKLRHSTAGVTLISPPPHHDIYSIEDLAQLIFDLKQINPTAKVSVKLVARSGVGTIAAGVVKAKADIITISGHSGGTGASPQTSIKYAGTPWEMGLSEVHQVLKLNGLRDKVVLRTDGGLMTGRDIVIAAILGAEEFSIGTAGLVAMGCLLVRQCHSNVCPVGICTQRPELRKHFTGTPEKVVNLFSFIAEETRKIMRKLGVSTLKDLVGRTDLLHQVSRGSADLDDLDLNPLLARPALGEGSQVCTRTERNEVPPSLDAKIVEDAKPALEKGEKMQLTYNVRNVHRAVGTRLSAHIVQKYGSSGLRPEQISVRLRGSAGQSLGAFGVQGLKLEILGDANDYVGKGLSGATITVRPTASSRLQPHKNSIVGNAVLYGATSGKLFVAGLAGDRFAVRNSGATVVVEGCGSNGCEYMTGGIAVILGPVGDNFAAGMTGGMTFVYDPNNDFSLRVNPTSVVYGHIETERWQTALQNMIREHLEQTESPLAKHLLEDWPTALSRFWQVTPKEILQLMKSQKTELTGPVDAQAMH